MTRLIRESYAQGLEDRCYFVRVTVSARSTHLAGRDQSPVDPAERLEATVDVPADVAAVLKRSCNDCHTNETVHPWYSNVIPVNCWLKSHFEHGREHLNFSTWAKYTSQQKEKRREEVC